MKDCMFQYATINKTYVDTDLITMDEALELFNKWKSEFKKHLDEGQEPEMAIWINCADETCYGETLHHWYHSEFMVYEGALWRMV